jgi:hypothetical protein
MKDNWFEDKMNERFKNFDSELDLHATWADLEERRQPKKQKRRTGIFWWLGAGLAVLFIGISLVFSSLRKTNFVENEATALLDNKTTQAQTREDLQLTDNQTNNSNSKTTKKLEHNIKKTAGELRKKTLEKVNNLSEKSNEINSNNKKFPNTRPVTLIEKEKSRLSKLDRNTEAPELYPTIVLLEYLEKDIPSLETKVVHHNIECDFRGTFQNLHTIGITFNYGKSFRNSPIGRGINSPYLQRRDEAETPLDAWSGQFFYQIKNKKSWFTRFNIGYSQTSDLFQDNSIVANLVQMNDQLLQINRYPDGTTEEIKGEALINRVENSTGKFYQRYRQAFVGVDFGKEKKFQSNFNLRASAGGEFTLYQTSNGKVYLDDISSFGNYQDLGDISDTRGGVFTGKLSLEIGKTFAHSNEISLGIVAKANLKTLKNDLERRQYLLSSLSYRKNF